MRTPPSPCTIFLLAFAIEGLAHGGFATRAHALTRHSTTVDGTLCVLLVTASRVPDATLIGMRSEVDRIWIPAGIDVQWLDAGSVSDDRVPDLRVMVDRDWHWSKIGAPAEYPVAEFQRSRALVSVSLSRAWSVVAQALGIAEMNTGPDRLRFNVLGLVLGRTIAHEIGHYLLGPEHRDSGLMRRAFHAREFVDRRSGAFNLGPADLARLAGTLRRPS